MKRILLKARTLVLWVGVMALAYFGFYRDVAVCARLAVFYAWWSAFLYVCAYSTDEGKKVLAKQYADGRALPRWMDVVMSVIHVGLMVGAGAWLTTIATMIALAIDAMVRADFNNKTSSKDAQ